MPNFGLRHSNRSQHQQLDSPQGQRPPSGHTQQTQPLAGPASASAEDKGYGPRLQPQVYSDTHNDSEQQYIPTPIDGPGGGSPYGVGDHSASTESHRYSQLFGRPQQQYQQHPQDFDFDEDNLNNPSQAPGIPGQLQKKNTVSVSKNLDLPVEPPKKSKSRSFFSGFSSKSQKEKEQQKAQPQQHQHHGFLGRSVSKKQSSKPELRMQQNNSTERVSHSWPQSQGSSSGTLPSHSEQDKDDFDPYQIREDEVEQEQHYDPRQDPRHALSVRVVDESHPQQQQYQQFQDQQHLQSASLYSPQQPHQPQQYQQFSQHTTPISPDQNSEYNSQQMPSQQQGQYQQQNLTFGIQPSTYRQQNPEVVSQLSHDSPSEQPDDRPPSVHSAQGYQHQYPSRKTSIAGQGSGPPQNTQQQGNMAPPQASGTQGRKSSEISKSLQPGESRGQPPAYNQGQFLPAQSQGQQPANLQSPLPPIPGQPQATGYRNSQLRTEFSATSDGRATPPVATSKQEDPNRDMSDYDKLMIKYKKVKGLYFDKTSQVESLQNTLANQRLSQSRTSLDDSEYLTRFQRLDSAIKEVSFAVRKDWSSVPTWLTPVVNADAMKTGTKEMTAVGRAVITRWLADEIWGKCFHPGLEPPLREELKRIENQIRGYGPAPSTLEDQESHTSKIIQWRLTTMEGLQWRLNSHTAHEAKNDFVQKCVSNLTAHLLQHLSEAAAMNIQGNATSIVELAVGIASHLPLESRDIVITYPTPKDMLQPWMKQEQALPPLEHYFTESSEDGSSSKSKEEEEKSEKGSKKLKSKNGKPKEPQGPTPEQLQDIERRKMEAKERIRFAGFVGVEIKGRQWLYQPPVWTIA